MKERLYFFDNIKAILILLVVFGHFIEPFIDIATPYLVVYSIIYAFHMPLFALVSGYFSSVAKKQEIFNLVKLFVVFEVIYAALMFLAIYFRPEQMQVLTGEHIIMNTVLEKVSFVLSPIWLLWYLLALIAWKLLLHIFKKSPWLIIVAIIMALLAGGINIPGGALASQRIFTIFPFFLVGYYINLEQIIKIKSSIFSKIIALLTVASSFLIIPKLVEIGPKILYFSDNYNELNMTFTTGIIVRSLLLLYAAMLCLSVIVFTSNKEKKYSYIGKYTIGIYLLHGIVLIILLSLGVFIYLYQLSFLINMLIIMTTSAFICYIFGKEYISQKIAYISFQKKKEGKK